MPAKPKQEKQISVVKEFINAATLEELRAIDIALKNRKHELISNNLENPTPATRLTASRIKGHDYLYIRQSIDGRETSRLLKASEVSDFDFETAKISPAAKRILEEKYDIHI